MASFSKVIVMGNLVRDPELRYISSGTAICTFTVAINRRYKSNDEFKETTSYIDVEAWGKQGETANEYLSKGRAVLVDGRLEQDRWTSQDGTKRSKHKIVANQVVFVGSRSDSGSRTSAEPPPEDDIPF